MSWTAILSGILTVLGSGSVLAGLQCILTHWGAGDLSHHWQECMALIVAGGAVASPGVNALKSGPFARPPAQQTKDPLSGEKR